MAVLDPAAHAEDAQSKMEEGGEGVKTVIMSIKGRHIRNMEAGKKRFELRKSRPAGNPPFEVLLCQSGSGGNIVAAFTCHRVIEMEGSDAEIAALAAITEEEARGYHGTR